MCPKLLGKRPYRRFVTLRDCEQIRRILTPDGIPIGSAVLEMHIRVTNRQTHERRYVRHL